MPRPRSPAFPTPQRRHRRRAPRSEPSRAEMLPQVNHAWRGEPPGPNHDSNRARMAEFDRLQCSATAEPLFRRPSAAAHAHILPEPPDPSLTHRIRSNPDRVQAARSRSDGRDLNIPVRPGKFAKEPLRFTEINPQSSCVQIYLQICPEFCTDPPEFSRNQTRHPDL